MKKTTKKLSLGMKIVAILACLALASVGFASWLILQVENPDTMTDGSFTVYSVDTKNVKIEGAAFTGDSAKIIFGKKTEGVTESWLIAGENVADENLKATLTFNVNLYDDDGQLSDAGAIKDYISEVELSFVPTGIDDAITANYITAPVITYSYKDNDNTEHTGTITYDPNNDAADLSISMVDADKNTVAVTVTIEFDWGTAFDNQNPYEYFNAKTANETSGVLKSGSTEEYLTYAAYASEALGKLNTIGATADYTINLTAKLNNNG